MSDTVKTVHVPLSGRDYDINIGYDIVHILPEKIASISPSQKSVVIITEENLVKYQHLDAVKSVLEQSGFSVFSCVLPSGEQTKNFDHLEKVVRFCVQNHVERGHCVIALGGGVIGDLTGFAASMIRRGCKFIQIPTTLLSMVDSSVGGKTAINTPDGKNLVGAFYQPSFVLADIRFLDTLPERDYNAGYAEVLKYGLLGNKDFFEFLSVNQHSCDARNPEFLVTIIQKSVQMKSDIVVSDEFERGDRALLNLGHTFGHAYEGLCGYSEKLLHGEAVALGMVHAAEYSALLGFISQTDADIIKNVIKKAHLPVELHDIFTDFDCDSAISMMMQDKKVTDGKATFILMQDIGKAFIAKNTDMQAVKNFLLEKTHKI